MQIIQEPKQIALWNKQHFEQKKWRVCSMFKKFSMYIVEKIYKMGCMEGSGVPVLCIGSTLNVNDEQLT
jgi:hypothetical protein